MKTTGNTVLITGGGSGIGRGLAEVFHAMGNHVVIAGRRKEMLDETTAANPGMESVVLNIEDPAAIRALGTEMERRFPALNVLINNAGIMRVEKLTAQQADLADMESTIATNLLGPIRLTAALLPLLSKQEDSVVINVSSGLAFVPLTPVPTYCATKAALHSYTESLRHQLRESRTQVIELVPPYVATDLLHGKTDSRAMPLDAFIAEVKQILTSEPNVREILVEKVKGLRFAESMGRYQPTFEGLNGAMASGMFRE